jgi:hypothetical protein
MHGRSEWVQVGVYVHANLSHVYADALQSVGWGARQTQFQGSVGKQARDIVIVSVLLSSGASEQSLLI